MRIFLSSSCGETPCARIETNLLGTKYEVVLDRTVQPFAQHQATHSHTPLLTFDKLPSLPPMQSVLSVSDEYDVPVVDLPSTMDHNFGGNDPDLASTDTATTASPTSPDLALRSEPSVAHDQNQSEFPPSSLSPAASISFLSRFRAKQGRSQQPLASPFASMTNSHDFESQSGVRLPSSAPASPAFTSFLARYQSARDSSSSGVRVPPTPANSPVDSHSFLSRAQSARADSSSPLQGSCGDPTCSCQMVPRAVGGVQYKTRIRGFMRPRRYNIQSFVHFAFCMSRSQNFCVACAFSWSLTSTGSRAAFI